MLVDAVFHGEFSQKTYNHTFICDDKTIWEAVSAGVIRTNFNEHYSHKKYQKPFSSRHIKLNLTPIERIRVINYLKEQEGKEYEFSNFIFHPLRTLFDKWLGKKNDKKLYCYELVIRAINASGKYDFDPYMNPREFYNIINQLQ